MSGFFNAFYYGKAGKADFTPEQLPTSRVQLFFEMLRVRFSGLVGINLLFVLCALPVIFWSFLNYQAINTALLIDEGADAALAAQALDAAALANAINTYLFQYLVLMIPLLGLLGIFSTGIIYVLRNWSRDQHSFVLSDFKDAVKANWKHGLIVGLINGLSLLLMYVAYRYYGMMALESVFWTVPQVLVLFVGAIWWMANMLMFPMIVTYDMPLKNVIRNSFIMVLARLPFSVLFWGVSLAFPIAVALLVPYGALAILLIYLVIGFSLTFFIYASYANSCFDRFLNPRIEGAQVNMGLRDPSLEDDVDEDEVAEEVERMKHPGAAAKPSEPANDSNGHKEGQ